MTIDFQKLCNVCYGGISVERKITGWGHLLCLLLCAYWDWRLAYGRQKEDTEHTHAVGNQHCSWADS